MIFFLFRQKTSYKMRIIDWSSDVCSSDLADRDLGFVECHPAVDRVEDAQRRAVEVDLGDHPGLGYRHVHRGGDADAGVEHAADHALHAVQRGDVGDEDGVGDAAGLHQLDVDDVGRSEEQTTELPSLMSIEYAVLCLTKQKKIIQSHTH